MYIYIYTYTCIDLYVFLSVCLSISLQAKLGVDNLGAADLGAPRK